MNKYIATIKVNGQSIKTTVFADSSIHAKLMLQYQFGIDCILSSPTLSTKEDLDQEPLKEIINRMKPIKPFKPLTPQQARIDVLKRQKEKAGKALDAERTRQKMAKDQKRIFNLSR
ncbi:MAG: hypothetical protein B7Y67_18620 [Polynucleobacter sp. 35-46-11]|uniref:hypothetical protein n=1 Tax=Polynucleobacter sp. 35-46-11 TaxID=1970425 RepID=UPI000BD87832|nr:hypothetical protein [Polynucleobacter sp. 35-46-11]OYY06860.1 MAG: hypothetical protein B7Y67_18620 [Polynucleobacter sp. 35-46-11]